MLALKAEHGPLIQISSRWKKLSWNLEKFFGPGMVLWRPSKVVVSSNFATGRICYRSRWLIQTKWFPLRSGRPLTCFVGCSGNGRLSRWDRRSRLKSMRFSLISIWLRSPWRSIFIWKPSTSSLVTIIRMCRPERSPGAIVRLVVIALAYILWHIRQHGSGGSMGEMRPY